MQCTVLSSSSSSTCKTCAPFVAVGWLWCMCFPGAHQCLQPMLQWCPTEHMRVLAPAARCMGCYILILLLCVCCVVGLALGGSLDLLIAHSVVTLLTVIMYTLRIPTYLLFPYSYSTALHHLKSPMNGLICWCFVSVVLPGSMGAERLLPAVLPWNGPVVRCGAGFVKHWCMIHPRNVCKARVICCKLLVST